MLPTLCFLLFCSPFIAPPPLLANVQVSATASAPAQQQISLLLPTTANVVTFSTIRHELTQMCIRVRNHTFHLFVLWT